MRGYQFKRAFERLMMKKANLVLMAALAAAGLVGVAGGSLLPVATAVAAPKEKAADKPKVSAAVLKPLAAAQKALNEKNYAEATTQLAAAQAVEPKAPYDSFMIDEIGWSLAVQQKDYVTAAAALERSLGSGFVPEADRPQRLKLLAQMGLQNKQYPKAIQYGEEYLKTAQDSQLELQLAQARYLTEDIAGAKAAAEKLVASASTPDEQALLLALRSNYELQDRAGTTKALEGLVRHYPQKKYWEDLLNDQLFRTKDDRGLRALYRLMNDTDTIDKPEDYAEMGTALITAGFPNEAKQVLERGMAAGVFTGDARARAQAELERAKSGAALDAKDMATADKQLATAKTGNEMIGIGKLYFSGGEYAKAVDALQKGLARGGLQDADDANMLLGIANARLKQAAEAKAAFDAVQNPTLAEVARLWKLKLDVDTAATPAG